jgi:hypothetical protein
MTKLVKCLALATFTQFITGYGQVHGDPDSTDERAREPMIPDFAVNFLLGAGKIAVEEHDAPAAPVAAASKPARKLAPSAAETDAPPV